MILDFGLLVAENVTTKGNIMFNANVMLRGAGTELLITKRGLTRIPWSKLL